jgi:hypothetical protein
MSLVEVILFGILLWLLYSLLQSYRGLESKISTLTNTCFNNGPVTQTPSQIDNSTNDPVKNMRGNLINILASLRDYAKI